MLAKIYCHTAVNSILAVSVTKGEQSFLKCINTSAVAGLQMSGLLAPGIKTFQKY